MYMYRGSLEEGPRDSYSRIPTFHTSTLDWTVEAKVTRKSYVNSQLAPALHILKLKERTDH